MEDLLAMKDTARRADLLNVRSIKGWSVMSEINSGAEPRKFFFPIPEGFSSFTKEQRAEYANALFEFMLANYNKPEDGNVSGGK